MAFSAPAATSVPATTSVPAATSPETDQTSTQWLMLSMKGETIPINVLCSEYLEIYKKNKPLAWLQLLQLLAKAAKSRLSMDSWSAMELQTVNTIYLQLVRSCLLDDTSGYEIDKFQFHTCHLIDAICQTKVMNSSTLFRSILAMLKNYADELSPEPLRYIGIMTLVKIMTSLAKKFHNPRDYVPSWHTMSSDLKEERRQRFNSCFEEIFEYIYKPIDRLLNSTIEIRKLCFDGLKVCIVLFPAAFVNDTYLPYVLNGVSDVCLEMRHESILLLQVMITDFSDMLSDYDSILFTVLEALDDDNQDIVLEATNIVFKLRQKCKVRMQTNFNYTNVRKALYSDNNSIRRCGRKLFMEFLIKNVPADRVIKNIVAHFEYAQEDGKGKEFIEALFQDIKNNSYAKRAIDHLLNPLTEDTLTRLDLEMSYMDFVIKCLKRTTEIPIITASDIKFVRKIKKYLKTILPSLLEKYANHPEFLEKVEYIQTYVSN